MRLQIRSRLAGLAVALGAATLALGVSSEALADHDESPVVIVHHPRHGNASRAFERRARHRVHVHGKAFRCRPCNARFASRQRLMHHVHRHHRVPLWRVPYRLVRLSFGWVFLG